MSKHGALASFTGRWRDTRESTFTSYLFRRNGPVEGGVGRLAMDERRMKKALSGAIWALLAELTAASNQPASVESFVTASGAVA